jgi:hypothetical protein
MAIGIGIAVTLGVVMWLGDFFFSQTQLLTYIVITMCFPFLVAMLFSIRFNNNAVKVICYSCISIMTHHLLVLSRTVYLFLNNSSLPVHVKDTLISFGHVLPIEVFIAVVAWFLMFTITKIASRAALGRPK